MYDQIENNILKFFMPSELVIVWFVILGLASGLLGGLLGIGGGVITVPILFFIFQYTGIIEERMMQVAVSTSLAAAVITSAVSTFAQWKMKAIRFSVFKLLVPGLVVGCLLGSLVGHFLSSDLLKVIFGGMAILLGVYFFFPQLPQPYIRSSPNWSLSFFSLLIGTLSSMLGLGGGALTFPVLMSYQVPAKNSSATSSLSTLLTTVLGSIGYLLIAWRNPELSQTFGYIEIPAFIAISVGSVVTAPIGVYLSRVLNVTLIKQIFGCCLALTGLSMLLR